MAALPLAPAVYLILLSLADAELHGYRLRAAVLERSQGAVKLDPGSLYRLIARLVDDALIAEAPARARPKDDDERRRYYRLTPLGRRVLEAETNRLADLIALARASGVRRART
jgi:DNA-binding PadR family transcriptional regulator